MLVRRLRLDHSHAAGRNRKEYNRSRKQFGIVLPTLNIQLPHSQATAFLGVYPRKAKTVFHENLYTHVYSSFTHNGGKVATTQLTFGR